MAYTRSKRHPELFKPGDGEVWWAFLPNPEGGRRLRASTGHRDEVAAYRWYVERVRAPVKPVEKDDIRLVDALERRRGERARIGRAPGTIRCYEQKGAQLTRLLGEDTPLRAIDARAIDHYVTKRLAVVTRSTVHKELVTLRGALKLARRQGYACPLPEEIMPLDFSPKYKPKTRALSEAEIKRLLAALPGNRAAVVAFLLATGATYPSEVQNLRKGDVNVERWTVHLRGTKRETRDRIVPIVHFARPWLEMALPYMPFDKWSNVRRDLHQACDELGIERCSPNDLRRSVATLLRARGVEPQLIGAYLGHADSRMVERVYGRLAPEALAHLLEQRLSGKRRRAV